MNKIKMFAKLSYDISAKYYCLLIVSCVISGIQILLNLYLPALFVETITGNSKSIVLDCTKNAVLIIISNSIFYILTQFIEAKLDVEKVYVKDMMIQKLSDKIMTISYEKIEDPKYLDLRQRALYAIETQEAMTIFIYTVTNVIKKIIIVIEMFLVLIYLSKFFMATILLLDIVIAGIYIIFKKYEKNFMDKFTKLSRRFSYYIGLCFDETIQKDIRLYDMSELLTEKVKEENRNILKDQSKYRKRRGLFYGMISVINIFQSVTSYAYIIFRTFADKSGTRLSYGQFTFYINAAINTFATSKELIFDIVNLLQILEYLEPYIQFMKLDEDKNLYGLEKVEPLVYSLEFRNVSFLYPATEKEVLKNVSFKILSNQKISIVGKNGAGKSTIVKLLCRLYKPTSGIIYVNNIDIWSYDKKSYDEIITTVLQDYKIFAISIIENISCKKTVNYEKVREWVEKLNIQYLEKKYKRGLYTVLNKVYEDEGIDLSGGEKQKIAIARALYKGGKIFILDEPTSSLDPKSEAEVFAQFEELTKDKMTIYISHRMSSSILCDKILVLDEGKVVDFNNHKELIKNEDGLYYRLFMAQAENYIE